MSDEVEPGGEGRYAFCSADELTTAFDQMEALARATLAEQLEVVAAYDATQRWKMDGSTSMATWLVARTGMLEADARERVRVAVGVRRHGLIGAALADGRLGFDHARHLLTLVDLGGNESELLPAATGCSVAQLRVAVREARAISAAQSCEVHAKRSLRWWYDDNRRQVVLRACLSPDDGAVFTKAITAIAERAEPDPVTGLYEPGAARAADALVEMASTTLAGEADADRATVVIHAPADALDGVGVGVTEQDAPIGSETLRRILCDARWQLTADGPFGATVGVGRMPGPSPVGWPVNCGGATAPAGFPVAGAPAGYTPTTSCTGSTADPPIWTIPSISAITITV